MAELVKDLVCDMDVDPESAAAKSEYQGVAYYFCAEGCKQSFDANPQQYLGGGSTAETAPAEASVGGAAPKRWWEFWKS